MKQSISELLKDIIIEWKHEVKEASEEVWEPEFRAAQEIKNMGITGCINDLEEFVDTNPILDGIEI